MEDRSVKDLDEWRPQAIEATGDKQDYSLQPKPNGTVYTVHHPFLMDDDQLEEIDRATGMLATAAAILGGQHVYTQFRGDGGRAGDVMMAWKLLNMGVDVDPNSSVFSAWSAVFPANSNPTLPTATPVSTAPSPNGGAPSSAEPAN